MTDDDIIKVAGLNHWFGGGDVRKQALFDINLTLKRGSFTVLMGPSGSGKTTVLTLIGCLRAVQDGSVQLLEQEINGASEADLVALRRRLGFIFQAHNLHESLTALQNVMMGLQVHPGIPNALAQKAAGHMLGLVGLSDRVNYLPGNLSGGQNSASLSRVPWWAPRPWSLQTSQPPHWIKTVPPKWSICSNAWAKHAAPPHCWSPMTPVYSTVPTAF